jgi:hypothetical protein
VSATAADRRLPWHVLCEGGAHASVTAGPYPERKAVIGGFAVVDVPSHEDALAWAAKIAAACRCAQEVRIILDDPSL